MAAHLAVDANTLDQRTELEALSLRLFGIRYLPRALSFGALIHINGLLHLLIIIALKLVRWCFSLVFEFLTIMNWLRRGLQGYSHSGVAVS